jgi:hypothetical protein
MKSHQYLPSLLALATLLSCSPTAIAGAPSVQSSEDVAFDHTHADFTSLLKDIVVPGGVRYADLKQSKSRLESYVEKLHAASPKQIESWTREQRFAFWINVYNAHTLWLVADHYPVKSIKDIGTLFTRVWNKQFIDMPSFDPEEKKAKLSLSEVEHEILRPQFKDARVHAAINCASESCPPLRAEAFVAESLDEQLEEQARAWLADESRNRFDATQGELGLSSIFDWFKDDFERESGSVQAWVAAHAPEETGAWLRDAKGVKIRFLDYSWKLNDAK